MIQIRIHQPSPVLDKWLTLNGYTTWVFITAWNPIGAPAHQLNQNISNNSALLTKLQQKNTTVLPGWGIPDVPEWPPEASFLVLGISKEEATSFSVAFGQRAFVFGRVKEKSELVVLDDKKHAPFYATTYSTAPLNLKNGKSLANWLFCLQARRVLFSTVPIECLFLQPYQTGYLCWMSS